MIAGNEALCVVRTEYVCLRCGDMAIDLDGVCSLCSGDTVETELIARSVSVYSVSQHYGGPEEGGWWHDWKTLECSVPTDGTVADVEKVRAFLADRFISCGDIHTTRGGVLYRIVEEVVAGENTSRRRPHYE